MFHKTVKLSSPRPELTDVPPLGLDAVALSEDYRRYFNHTLGRDEFCTSVHYMYEALAMVVRDRLLERWKKTNAAYHNNDVKRVYYLSLEFLMGRALSNAMLNLGLSDEAEKALEGLGLVMEELRDGEPDAGLGNGGLGRLAACFLDSCATLQLPVVGYGLRYEYGMFRQLVAGGKQVEEPDHWLVNGNPWELERPELQRLVQFGGRSEHYQDARGVDRVRWVDSEDVWAIPYDVPVPGYRNETVNTLRLWKSSATDEFNLREFNAGSYTEAVSEKNAAENITLVLYPNDASENGKELRLRQQYLLASASLQDVVGHWVRAHGEDFTGFADKNGFQLNDTHPSVAVAELMRLLMDEHLLGWDAAWAITTRTMAYTNHTLLPEALERWSVDLFRHLLPRPLEIIEEINRRHLLKVAARWPGNVEMRHKLSIIGDGDVRMAYLAVVGSHSVNGVAELHTNLLKHGLFGDFHAMWPERFNNKTNGVTQRRWLAMCNPALSDLINERIGSGWVTELSELAGLRAYRDDKAYLARWREVKQLNKQRLAKLVKQDCGIDFPLESLFDVQVKRIHEYKRQLLNILHVIHLYDRIKRGDTAAWTNRCVLIGGKAAPGYWMAKRIIKLVCAVAEVVNHDLDVGDKLKVAFLPNYRVSAMEIIAPGTDLSEQISTAGKEASGTGNMKFMMNGALTIGTLDGANIEIREEAGEENFFLFGLTESEVESLRPNYDPNAIIAADEDLARVVGLIENDQFCPDREGRFQAIVDSVRNPHDPWMTAADFRSYVNAQREAANAYQDPVAWSRMSLINTASSGKFSTDRTMHEYNADIWKLVPTAVGKA
ncbi:MAG: glycogen/starch/alpha-glucan phosphorylase [Gammaproteobacteria bacterium]|nr:glycogen/starch/alpha-glucan phosphorylase [Gammaproteobacteria bacterium]MCP5136807.1 glycogen/starch/alpha-glucan phosphorylase [Gammaproteobacteria bacterium]